MSLYQPPEHRSCIVLNLFYDLIGSSGWCAPQHFQALMSVLVRKYSGFTPQIPWTSYDRRIPQIEVLSGGKVAWASIRCEPDA